MVDYNMFRRIHPKKAIFISQADDLGSTAMNRAEPPSDEFLAMLPPQLHAFDFSAKGFSTHAPYFRMHLLLRY